MLVLRLVNVCDGDEHVSYVKGTANRHGLLSTMCEREETQEEVETIGFLFS